MTAARNQCCRVLGALAAVAAVTGCNAGAPAPTAHPTPTVVAAPSPRPPVATAARRAEPAVPSIDGGDTAAPADQAGWSRRETRKLVEGVVEHRLGRTLPAADTERLTDAVIRLRTASRALRTDGDDVARAGHREDVRQALADIEAITGLPPAELGDALTADAAAP